jgi:hypothetical protein
MDGSESTGDVAADTELGGEIVHACREDSAYRAERLQCLLSGMPALPVRVGEVDESFEDVDPRKAIVISLRQERHRVPNLRHQRNVSLIVECDSARLRQATGY